MNKAQTIRLLSMAAVVAGLILLTGKLWADVLLPYALDETGHHVISPVLWRLWQLLSFSLIQGAILIVFGSLGIAYAHQPRVESRRRPIEKRTMFRVLFSAVLCAGGMYTLVIGVSILMAPRGGFNLLLILGPMIIMSGYGLMFRAKTWGRIAAWSVAVIMTVLSGILMAGSVFLGGVSNLILSLLNVVLWIEVTGPFVFFLLLLLYLWKTRTAKIKPAQGTTGSVPEGTGDPQQEK